MIHKSILELIGNTPMVRLNRVTSGLTSTVLAKLEYLNPSGSLKDRIALEMIEQAEKNGELRPGYTIVDASTGNTGIALALVSVLKGYRVVIYQALSGDVSTERTKIMRNLGADVKVVVTDREFADKSVPGAEIELPARKACLDSERENHDVWWARQFSNSANVEAHKKTGEEILSQTHGNIDVFVASIGTGGTLMGIAEVLKKEREDIVIVGVQPASSLECIQPGGSYPRSNIKGGIVSDMLEKNLVDEVITVSDEEAVAMTHRLWREEGLLAGISSGANVLAAIKKGQLIKGKTLVTILPDSMNRYLTEEHYVT
ncbi:MAG: PLP-dependent cysteine synthase family protein [Theionarchaea archaeon]|nr:PLP-dependent cysteine synthase family protein [Theionarchaea archaeon]